MTQIVQQPYNLFAQQKMAGYPSYQDTQKRVPGQVQGETPEQFAAGKQAANSQTGAVSVPVVEQTSAPVVQNTKPQPSGNTKVVTAPMDANSPTAGMDYLNSLYTSPQEEERLRKANVMNQRILAIGDALRHIGNIATTVNYAPAQQFNNPALEAEARYEKGKELRDRANQQYYTYQQQKAAQDAKMRQLEADRKQKADQWNATFKYNAAKAAAEMEEKQRQFNAGLAYKKENDKANRELREKQINANFALGKQRNSISAGNLALSREKFEYLKSKGAGGRGNSSYDYATPNGNITMPKNFNQTQKDQVLAKFDRYIDRSDMQRQMMALGLNSQDPAQVRNYQFAKMLQEHQDVADYVSEKFGGKQTFTSNPLARPEASVPQPMFQTPWGGAAYSSENPYDQYLLSDEGQSETDDDYEQYLIQ